METRSQLEEADRMSRLVGGRPIHSHTWYACHERHTHFLAPPTCSARWARPPPGDRPNSSSGAAQTV